MLSYQLQLTKYTNVMKTTEGSDVNEEKVFLCDNQQKNIMSQNVLCMNIVPILPCVSNVG